MCGFIFGSGYRKSCCLASGECIRYKQKIRTLHQSVKSSDYSFLVGRGGFDSCRATRLRSFAALDVHRTSIHYRSYFESTHTTYLQIKKQLSSLSTTEFWWAGVDSTLAAPRGFGHSRLSMSTGHRFTTAPTSNPHILLICR